MIRIEDITKRYKKLTALEHITVEFNAGQIVSLIGPNGSGKTTLIKCILGLVQPDSGNIFFNGQSIHNKERYRSQIGYMPQIGRYPENMKIRQVIDMIRNIRHAKADEIDNDLYKAFGIADIAEKRMQSLSGGTRQKVSATLAFMFNPPVLILDEPTAGLDPLSSEILKDKIIKEKEKGKLMLISSHILSDLDQFGTDVMYLQDGRLQFMDTLEHIKEYTGEDRLGKAIATIMHRENKKAYTQYLLQKQKD